MRISTSAALFGTALVCSLFAVSSARAAQLALTWVSGVGDDANPCERVAPCLSYSGALANTAAGGEIQTLDPLPTPEESLANTVTITKSISIYNGSGGTAGTFPSGTNGITISAGATDVVNLRGLTIDGSNSGSGDGILITSAGRVNIEDCVIQGFGPGAGAGIAIMPSSGTIDVHIRNTIVKNNASGILILPSGGASVIASVDHSTIANNTGGGIKADSAGGPVGVAMMNSTVTLNGSNGVNAVGGAGGNVTVDMIRDVISWNGLVGIQANPGAGAATVTVGYSTLSNNGSAVHAGGAGQVQSYGNNQVTGPVGTGFSSMIALQ